MPFGLLAKAVPLIAKAIGGSRGMRSVGPALGLTGGVQSGAAVLSRLPKLSSPIAGAVMRGAGTTARVSRGATARFSETAPGLVRTVTGRVSGIMTKAGRYFPMAKVKNLVRQVGLDAAAVALGITVADLATSYADAKTTRRRGRGISAADVRRTCRTLGQINRIQAKVKACSTSCAPRMPYRRRKT
jgi:histone H3/H4